MSHVCGSTQSKMLDFTVNSASWLMFVPAFACGFYAVNMWSVSTGLMDPLIPFLFGTSAEMLPILLGPAGKAIFLSNAFSQTGLCYAFLPSTGMPTKAAFTAFLIVQVPWLPLLYYMFTTGLFGTMGVGMFGSFAVVVTALSSYTYTKL